MLSSITLYACILICVFYVHCICIGYFGALGTFLKSAFGRDLDTILTLDRDDGNNNSNSNNNMHNNNSTNNTPIREKGHNYDPLKESPLMKEATNIFNTVNTQVKNAASVILPRVLPK